MLAQEQQLDLFQEDYTASKSPQISLRSPCQNRTPQPTRLKGLRLKGFIDGTTGLACSSSLSSNLPLPFSDNLSLYCGVITTSLTCITRTHNRITIDKGLLLADSPSKVNLSWILDRPFDISVIETLINKHMFELEEFVSRQRFSTTKYRAILSMLLANLYNSANRKSQLLYSRTGSNGNKIFLEVIDYLDYARLCLNVIGRGNEYQGNSSWLLTSKKLYHEIQEAQASVGLKKNAVMVKLKSRKKKQSRKYMVNGKEKKETYYSKGKCIPIKTGYKPKALLLKRLSKAVNLYNEMWHRHELTLDRMPLVAFVSRIFTADICLGGRYYGDIQTMRKTERMMLKIDGEETVEPDFKALHLCMLYARRGVQLDPINNDPYKIDGFDRPTVKLAMLSFINSEHIKAFKRNITKSGNPEIKELYHKYQADNKTFVLRSSQGFPAKEPFESPSIRGFIEGMPDGINGGELVASLLKTHHEIKDDFGTKDIGLKLQFSDSEIMSKILTTLSNENIPVIPVHDSVRCKKTDLDRVIEVMHESYLAQMGFKSTITIG